MSNRQLSVLIVDDEIHICEMIKAFLERSGYQAETAQSGKEALQMIQEKKPDIVFLDLNMPHMDGETTFDNIKTMYSDLPVLFITGNMDKDLGSELIKKGAINYITKPFKFHQLKRIMVALEILNDMRPKLSNKCSEGS